MNKRQRGRWTRRDTWPFGCPTKPCDGCNGSGAAPGALAEAQARKTDGGYSVVRRCETCGGRGRLMDTSKLPLCGHGLLRTDCKLCSVEPLTPR